MIVMPNLLGLQSNINRSASVPKFGAWDEMDPNEGYTVIFDKVKEEKQNAATKFTAAPPKPSNSVNNQIKPTRSKVRIQRYLFNFHLIMV